MFHSLRELPTIDVNTNRPSRLRVQFKDICPQELVDKHNGLFVKRDLVFIES